MRKIIARLKVLIKDKRGEELCTHMYTPFARFIARSKAKRGIKKLGYNIVKSADGRETLIFDRSYALIGKIKTIRYNRQNIEPTVFLKNKIGYSGKLERAILNSGCSVEYFD